MTVARRLLITGQVQGVYFRESMRLKAEELGVSGWVRNRADGAVEALIQGEERSLEVLLDWAGKGPPAARVDEIRVETTVVGPHEGFLRRPSV